MHLILFEHCRPNTVELDKSILGGISFTTTVHFRFQCEKLKRFGSIIFFFFNFQIRTVTSGDNK